MRIFFLSLILLIPALQACTLDEGKQTLVTAKDFVLERMPDGLYSTDTQPAPRLVAEAFTEALNIGSDSVTSTLGSIDGFYRNAQVKIPLPDRLQQAANIMDKIGLNYISEDLVKKINRAAETATPHAKELFLNAVNNLSFDDVMAIYNGPNNSATQYFQGAMSTDLAARLRPHIERTVGQEGVVLAYNRFVDQVAAPLNLNLNINDYVLDKTIAGIFLMIGQKETAIRTNPAEQTSALLKQVFGKKDGFVNRIIDTTVTGAKTVTQRND